MALPTLSPVSHEQFAIADGFWAKRLRTVREATIPHVHAQLEAAGSFEAFRQAAKGAGAADERRYRFYRDSDVAKWMEGAARCLANRPDPGLGRTLEEAVGWVVAAQQEDGYLNTHYTLREPGQRWTNLRDKHELYCAGHLMEAAVAHFRATGRRHFLGAICRYADCIARTFGRGAGQLRGYPGHPEIELALVQLFRATGERRYLDLARFFVDERGRQPHWYDQEARARGEDPAAYRYGNYEQLQAHVPVREQHAAVGHAVRAAYLYAGMADVAEETGDEELLAACRRIWGSIAERRMYVHGGIGSSAIGERFTQDWHLPNAAAYAETCAAIALVFFSHRMLQLEPHRRYADAIERALFNNVLAGLSSDGRAFFYANYLGSVPGTHRFTGRQMPPERQPWYTTACCPTNLCRFFPALGQYVASASPDALHLHQFVNGRLDAEIGGVPVRLEVQGGYPWDGRVRLVLTVERTAEFALAVRLPGWCRSATAAVDGGAHEPLEAAPDGYAKFRRKWEGTSNIALDFAMPVERVEAHPGVGENCGRVALQRGPVLYCLEECDNGPQLNDISLPAGASLALGAGAEGLGADVPVIVGRAVRRDLAQWDGQMYRAAPSPRVEGAIRAVPYFLWANRGSGEMVVWVRQETGS